MMAPKIRPWHDDREQLADLIEWLHSRRTDRHGEPLFFIQDRHDVGTVIRNPGEFAAEWRAFMEHKVAEIAGGAA